MATISIVIPVYNEQGCLRALFERLAQTEETQPDTYKYIFVDDGSTDGSREIIVDLARAHDHVTYLLLSRNFGHEAATTAGLDHANGDAVVIIDGDLQDPPEVIPQLVEQWRQGHHIVYAQRRTRKGENIGKRFTSWLFYRIIRRLSAVDIPYDTGDFRLIDRAVVEQFRKCREQSRFVRALIAWTGFKQVGVLYDRDERYAGKTKYTVPKLLVLAFDGVFGFSNHPLRIGIFLGLLVCLACLAVAASIVVEKFILGIEIPGYALLATGIFFIGGVQLSVLGLLGEYIGRIYRQTQQRPLYIVADKSDALTRQNINHVDQHQYG